MKSINHSGASLFVNYVAALASLLLLGATFSMPSVAQETVSLASAEVTPKIQSWTADPLMSQEEEARIIRWIKERSKSKLVAENIVGLVEALRDTVPSEHPFEIVLDVQALEELGLSADTPIASDGNLVYKLQPLDLTFMIRHGGVYITTDVAADANAVIRIYDVTPLVVAATKDDKRSFDYSELLETIVHSIRPDIWEQLGGSSTLMPMSVNGRRLLVVSTTSSIHLQLQSLLDQLAVAGNVVQK